MKDQPLEIRNRTIANLNPRTRILMVTVFSLAAALSDHPVPAVVYLILALGFVFFAGVPFKDLAARLKPVFWFLVMIWVFLPLTFPGRPILSLPFMSLSAEGVAFSFMISVKSVAILPVFTGLLASMSVASLGSGLYQLKKPDKMIFLLLMTYRYIFVIEDEYQRLMRAARFRGFVPKTSMHSYRTFAYLAGMLFVRASLRANRVYQAMLCRGFKGKFHTLDPRPSNGLNCFFFTVTVMACFSIIVLEAMLT